MGNFICDNSKRLWEIFEKTGSPSAYLLFSAVEHGKYQDLYDTQIYDKGMEL